MQGPLLSFRAKAMRGSEQCVAPEGNYGKWTIQKAERVQRDATSGIVAKSVTTLAGPPSAAQTLQNTQHPSTLRRGPASDNGAPHQLGLRDYFPAVIGWTRSAVGGDAWQKTSRTRVS